MLLKWSIEGETQLMRTLTKIANEVQDFTPAFRATAKLLTEEFSQNAFATEGNSLGQKWAPLNEEYAAWKEKHYPGKGILVRTGKMQKSFKTKVDSMSAEITNAATYFKYHQSNAPRTKLPRRMMMFLTNPIKTDVAKIFHTYWHSVVHGNATLQ